MGAKILRFERPSAEGFILPMLDESPSVLREDAYRKAAEMIGEFRAYHQRVADSSRALQSALLDAADELANKRT